MQTEQKRTAREILINKELLKNDNVTVRIGAAENRNFPETIYIYISFWIKPKLKFIKEEKIKKVLKKDLKNIYEKNILPKLKNNTLFPIERENIYICNIPESFNYNDKSNFISLELYLHTANLTGKEKYSFSKKKPELLNAATDIANTIITTKVLKGKKNFNIYKTSKN